MPKMLGSRIATFSPLEAQRDAFFAGQQQRLQQGQQHYSAQPQQPLRSGALTGFYQPNPARAQADAIMASDLGAPAVRSGVNLLPGHPNYQSQVGPSFIAQPARPGYEGPVMIPAGQGGYQPFGRQFVPGTTPQQRMQGLASQRNFQASPFTGDTPIGGTYTSRATGNELNVVRLPDGRVRVTGPPGGERAPVNMVGRAGDQRKRDLITLRNARKYNLDPRNAPAVWEAATRLGIQLPQMAASRAGMIGIEDRRQGLAPGPWLPPIGPGGVVPGLAQPGTMPGMGGMRGGIGALDQSVTTPGIGGGWLGWTGIPGTGGYSGTPAPAAPAAPAAPVQASPEGRILFDWWNSRTAGAGQPHGPVYGPPLPPPEPAAPIYYGPPNAQGIAPGFAPSRRTPISPPLGQPPLRPRPGR